MRRAAQRLGVAIAFQEIAPRHRGLRLVDVEFRIRGYWPIGSGEVFRGD